MLLLFYAPDLDPYPGYSPVQTDSIDNTAYEELPEAEEICPERRANILSGIYNLSECEWFLFGILLDNSRVSPLTKALRWMKCANVES